MATKIWCGRELAVAQVDTITPGGTITSGDTFTVSCGGRSVTTTGHTTVAGVCNALLPLMQAAGGEFSDFTTALDNPTTPTKLICTSNQAGRPFTISTSASGSATLTRTTTVANAGPNRVAAANFIDAASGAAGLPGAGDSVELLGSGGSEEAGYNADMLYDLETLAGVAVVGLHARAGFSGQVGLPEYNAEGDYAEYRPRWLKAPFLLITITCASRLFRLDTLTTNVTATVYATGQPLASDSPTQMAFQWRGTGTSGTGSGSFSIYGGSVALVPSVADAGDLAAVNVAGSANPTVYIGSSLWDGLATLTIDSGQVTCLAKVTTQIKQLGGRLYYANRATNTLGTAHILGGTLTGDWVDTITTLNLASGAHLDRRESALVVTVTNANVDPGAKISDPLSTVTWTNGVNTSGGRWRDYDFDFGVGRTYQVSG